MITLDDIVAVQKIIADKLHRTPMLGSQTFSKMTDLDLSFKAEFFQKTGSFKPRGVLNRIANLTPDERSRGLIGVSAGNHAQALAYAAQQEGLPAIVVMPEKAVKSKADGARGYGANVILHGGMADVFPKAHELIEEHGYTLIHPFDHPHVAAGQGTVGLEILEDVPDVDVVVVPVGGGGLISGIASAIKLKSPNTKVIGVEPEGASAMTQSLKAGKAVKPDRIETIADGLAAPFAGELNYQLVDRYVDEIVLVSDNEIAQALKLLLERSKILTEPAGAAGLAALLNGKISIPAGARVVCVLSGGNLDLDRATDILNR